MTVRSWALVRRWVARIPCEFATDRCSAAVEYEPNALTPAESAAAITARPPPARCSGLAPAVPSDQAAGSSVIVVGSGRPPQSSSSAEFRAIEVAVSASDRSPSSSTRLEPATPIRLPIATRRFNEPLVSATFWWISLLANRVSWARSSDTSASTSVAPAARARATARSAIASVSSGTASRIGESPPVMTGSPLADPDLHVVEPPAGPAVADMAALTRLALAAIRRPEHDVARFVADGVERAPELVRDPGVGRVLEEPALLAALDLVGDLGRELEVQAAIVDRPRPIRGEVQAVVGPGDDVVEALPELRQEVDVGHPDQRDPVPAVGPHRPARLPADPGRGLAAAEIPDEDPVLDERHRLRRDALVVPAERAHPARRRRIGHDIDEVAAVAEALVELVGRQEARAGVARLGPAHPDELGRVAAALVDLEVELGWVEDDGEPARRALGRSQQRDAFLGQRARVADEVEAAHELVPGGPEWPSVGVGIASPLVLVALDRVGLDAGTDVGERLLGPAAVRRPEGPRLALGVVARLDEGRALDRAGHLVGGEQVADLLLQGHRERVLLDRRLVRPVGGRAVVEPDAVAQGGGAGPGDADGLAGDPVAPFGGPA